MTENLSGNRLALSFAMAILSFALFHGATAQCTTGPSPITTGTFTPPSGSSPDGTTIAITCKDAFTGAGSMGAFMCSGSSWMESTSCAAVSCATLPAPTNGNVQLKTMGSMGYGDRATVTCNTGYKASVMELTCGRSNSWGTAPTCTLKDCGTLATSNVANSMSVTTSGTTYQSTATVTCKPGYEASATTVECLATGSWTAVTCRARDCGTFTVPNSKSVSTTNTTFPSNATYVCNTGYQPSSTIVACQNTGSWEAAACTLADCGNPTVSNSSRIVVSNTTFNNTAMGVCPQGFTTDNGRNFTLTCAASGNWTGSTCQAVDCGSLTVADSLSVNVTTGTTYNKNATITCLPGFVPLGQTSNSTSRCQLSGAWETFTCSGAAAFLPGQLCWMLAIFMLLSLKFY